MSKNDAQQVKVGFYDSITMGMGIYVGFILAGMIVVIMLGGLFLCLAALFPAILVSMGM